MPVELHREIAAYMKRRSGEVADLTLTSERCTLRNWAAAMGNRQLCQIGPDDLAGWLATMRHLAPSTRRYRFTVVRAFLDCAALDGKISRNPARRLRTPTAPAHGHRALSYEQAGDLLNGCRDSRDRLIILLGLHLGLRRAEIAGLTMDAIDWSTRHIHVTGKGSKTRGLPIPDELWEALQQYLEDQRITHGAVIRNTRGGAVPPVWVGRAVSRIGYASGVKRQPRDGVGTHSLRHTAATHIARETGGDVQAVRDTLGHASLATTQVYVDRDPERLRGAVSGRTYVKPGTADVA